MTDSRNRRFTILDGMALVAAAAVGAALARAYYGDAIAIAPRPGRPLESREWVYLTSFVALPFAAALAWCRLRRPWRNVRRLAREPGLVALLAVAISAVAAAIDVVLSKTLPELPGARYVGGAWTPLFQAGRVLATLTGPAVCAAWSTEWLVGYWRPNPGWVDHAGRAFGIIWILLFALRSWFVSYIWL
jgi:hypothetical protein